jgi:hypothetical protein
MLPFALPVLLLRCVRYRQSDKITAVAMQRLIDDTKPTSTTADSQHSATMLALMLPIHAMGSTKGKLPAKTGVDGEGALERATHVGV